MIIKCLVVRLTTDRSHLFLINQQLKEVWRVLIIFHAEIYHIYHLSPLIIIKSTTDVRHFKYTRHNFVEFILLNRICIIFDLLLILCGSNLTESCCPDEHSEVPLSANPALLVSFRQYFPLRRALDQTLESKLPGNHQFLLFDIGC